VNAVLLSYVRPEIGPVDSIKCTFWLFPSNMIVSVRSLSKSLASVSATTRCRKNRNQRINILSGIFEGGVWP